MNRYHLTHITMFHYDAPVSESYNEVCVRPMQDDRQSCLSFRLFTSPPSHGTDYCDAFGNWIHQFNILAEHRHLTIEAESVVLTHEVPAPPRATMSLEELDAAHDDLREEFFDFIAPTNYVPHNLPEVSELVNSAVSASQNGITGFAQSASDLIHNRFQYQKGATHVQSSILDALKAGAGVCQDFAHILLSVLRQRGLPARYVSGYIAPKPSEGKGKSHEEVIGGQASHAWVEVWLPGSGWMGLDPTLGAPVGLRHVRIAYGRDYGDVAPVRGVYKGQAGQRLSVDVRLRPGLDEDGREQLQKAVAVQVEEPVSERPQQPEQQQQQ